MTMPVPPVEGPEEDHRRQLADGIRALAAGNVNTMGTITLTANAATSTLTSAYLHAGSTVHFDPMTANAATELYGGTMYVLEANRGDGSWTITHANNAQTDRKFTYRISG